MSFFMKYYFTFAVDGYWDISVEADSLEKAKAVAENEFDYADFGEASLAEGKIIQITDSKGNVIWEQECYKKL